MKRRLRLALLLAPLLILPACSLRPIVGPAGSGGSWFSRSIRPSDQSLQMITDRHNDHHDHRCAP